MTRTEAFTAAHSLARFTIQEYGGDYRVTFAACLRAVYALRNTGCTVEKAGGINRFNNHIIIGVSWAATLAYRVPRPAYVDPFVGMLGTGDDLANAA